MASVRSKTLAMGLVALMAITATFVAIPVLPDESSATSGSGTADDPYTSITDAAAFSRQEIWAYVGCVVDVYVDEYDPNGIFLWTDSGLSIEGYINTELRGTLTRVGDFTLGLNPDSSTAPWSHELVTIHVVNTPVVLNVSDMTVAAGDYVLITPVADPSVTLTVSGAAWLTATQNVVSGIAPSTTGEYQVTISAGSSSATFTITVTSKLAPTNSPTSGAIVFPR